MDEEIRKTMQRIQADPNIRVNWKLDCYRNKKEIEQARMEKEAWELVDTIKAKHRAIKYKNSSKFTRFWMIFFEKF